MIMEFSESHVGSNGSSSFGALITLVKVTKFSTTFDEQFHWLRPTKEILSIQLMGGDLNWLIIVSSMGGVLKQQLLKRR